MRLTVIAAPFLIGTLAFPASPSAAAQLQTEQPAPPSPQQAQSVPARLTPDQKALLVLSRFTYGPRPGDLEHLRAIGLNEWFHQQLNPSLINDAALDTRLADYPATRLPLDKLMELYPTNGMVRAAMNGNAVRPHGDAARAIYNDQMERYKNRKNAKNGADPTPSGNEAVALPQSPTDILALPPDQRFKALCRLTLPQLRELRKGLTADQRDHLTDGMTPQQTEAIAAFSGPRGVVEAEDIQVKLLRDIYSERQLQEVMVDFWLNHFNVFIGKSEQAPYYIAAYERDAIRRNALGSFENLLAATATSPAMLNYLDNASSIGPRSDFARGIDDHGRLLPRPANNHPVGLNENYARELMELHTVGVNGGYTQRDVTEVAKVFTGWTVGRRFREDPDARAEFDPRKHEPGDKFVMGQKIKFGGSSEGFAVLHLLASSQQCARFISTRLAVRFVSDDPPPAMISRMSAAFLETHGDIRRVLLAMVNSPEFFTAATWRAKVKTPQDYVLSAVRASGSSVQSTAGLATAIADLGMPLYGHQTPDGYSMRADPWNNTASLVSRMNFALALASNRVAGVTTNFDALLTPATTPTEAAPPELTPEQKATTLETTLLHTPVSDRTHGLILAQTANSRAQQASDLRKINSVQGRRDPLAIRSPNQHPQDLSTLDTQSAIAAGLILGSPEFQRR